MHLRSADSGSPNDNAKTHHKLRGVKGVLRGDLDEGVVVDLTAAQAAVVASDPDVLVSPNTPVNLDQVVPAPAAARAATDIFRSATHADQLVASGIDGSGQSIAVLDTGIDAALPDFGGRVIGGVDFSGENNPYQDSFGHGTFVAGLAAGNGASSGGIYKGEAPNANLVAIKVSGASGAVVTSTVIKGVDWAVANKNTFNIRVLNMSLGTSALESTTTAPLNAAVERAWAAGIVVVVSAGNYGPVYGTIAKPGDDPLVITTAATDDQGSATAADDTIPSFSSVGPTYADGWFKPDVALSGRSVVSVMAPGSTIALAHPEGMVGTTNFRGSGTSFSSAILSGAAALIIQKNPAATPDNVKGRILGTTVAGPVGNPFVDGHGIVDAAAAASASNIVFSQANAVRSVRPILKLLGLLAHPMLASPGFNAGEQDLGDTWVSSTWNGSGWNGSTGSGPWNGSGWNGSGWNGSGWNGSGWNGSGWNGSGWNGSSFDGSGWNGSGWNGSGWNGSGWNGSGWNGSGWNDAGWNGSGWD